MNSDLINSFCVFISKLSDDDLKELSSYIMEEILKRQGLNFPNKEKI